MQCPRPPPPVPAWCRPAGQPTLALPPHPRWSVAPLQTWVARLVAGVHAHTRSGTRAPASLCTQFPRLVASRSHGVLQAVGPEGLERSSVVRMGPSHDGSGLPHISAPEREQGSRRMSLPPGSSYSRLRCLPLAPCQHAAPPSGQHQCVRGRCTGAARPPRTPQTRARRAVATAWAVP